MLDIIKELGLTAANVDDYEDTETVSQLIVPFASEQDEVYQTAAWVASLHQGAQKIRYCSNPVPMVECRVYAHVEKLFSLACPSSKVGSATAENEFFETRSGRAEGRCDKINYYGW